MGMIVARRGIEPWESLHAGVAEALRAYAEYHLIPLYPHPDDVPGYQARKLQLLEAAELIETDSFE